MAANGLPGTEGRLSLIVEMLLCGIGGLQWKFFELENLAWIVDMCGTSLERLLFKVDFFAIRTESEQFHSYLIILLFLVYYSCIF